jgi:hypothetical protein
MALDMAKWGCVIMGINDVCNDSCYCNSAFFMQSHNVNL